jgi:glycosyltransferase involved in cell wall biosynthesis
MRIALSTSVIQRGKTGIGQYVFGLVKALLPHTTEHQFYLLVLEQDLPLFEFASRKMALVPVAEQFRSPLKNILWHQVSLPRWLKANAIDVLHVPSYRRMLFDAPCALVTTIHDLGQFHVAEKYDSARMFYARVVARRLARRQDEIIAISQSTVRDIHHFFGVSTERIHLAHNGFDDQRFAPGPAVEAKAEVKKRWSIDRPFFLYVSAIAHPQKNHVRLIEAFNQFRNITRTEWQLVLVGSDWGGSETVHAKAQQSPYANDIRFLGFVDDAALPTLYRAAEVTVCPSLYEGFGLPPVEAMACGCPVLSSMRGGLTEVLGDAAGALDPEDVSQMAQALQRAAIDAKWRQELRKAGLKNAKRFNWGDHATRVLHVYGRAVQLHVARLNRVTRLEDCHG